MIKRLCIFALHRGVSKISAAASMDLMVEFQVDEGESCKSVQEH